MMMMKGDIVRAENKDAKLVWAEAMKIVARHCQHCRYGGGGFGSGGSGGREDMVAAFFG